jgi:hypothetical protein
MLNDGQPGYLCVKCDVYWPSYYFEPSDLATDMNRRICSNHRAKLTHVKHGMYSEREGGTVIGCFEPGCEKCTPK